MRKSGKLTGFILLSLVSSFFCSVSAQQKNAQQTTVEVKDGDYCPAVTSMLDTLKVQHSISSLKGKYVLVDVWASWCYPCRKQFPYLQKIEDAMRGKNIIFLGISTDSQDFRWIGILKIYKLQGTQWWDKDGSFTKAFQVLYIPRFILIDPKGKVVKSHMSLPSDPATLPYLQKLCK